MSFTFNFGQLSASSPTAPSIGGKFRLAVLGDFSARAQRGVLEKGEKIAQRKPIKVDCDNFEKVLQRVAPKLTLQIAGAPVELEIRSLDDFHPDQLFDNLEIFSELAGFRQRLKTTSGFAKAAAEVQSWSGESAPPVLSLSARGAVLPEAADLSDFAALLGQPSAPANQETAVEDLLRKIVGPYIVPAADPRQEAMLTAVDEALSATMRSVLHHPDFQALESLWRSVDLLVRRLETGAKLEVVLLDLSAEELAAALSSGDDLPRSSLYQWLVEQPALDEHQGPFSALVCHYTFARTRPQAELLGRLAKLASAIPAAIVTSMAPSLLEEKPEDLAPEISQAWQALASLPEAGYLGLLTPSFLLRQPYGRRSDPVDCFAFEEITPATDLRGFLYGNPAVLAGLLLGETSTELGSKMQPGSRAAVGDLPFFFTTDQHGDQEALPCTERLMTLSDASVATTQGFIPVVGLKGRPEVRLGSWQSLTGSLLAGPWAPIAASSVAPAAPVASPTPAASLSSGDPELDALLSGLDEPPPAAPEPPAGSGDPELDALLAGLDEPPPAPEPEPPAEPEEPAGSGDPELDALLAGLDEPEAAPEPPAPKPEPAAEPDPTSGDPDLDALLSGLDEPEAAPEPPASEPQPAAELESTAGDPDLDALLSGLDETEVAPELPALEPEPAAAPEPTSGDPDLDALLSGLDEPEAVPELTAPEPEPAAEPENPAAEAEPDALLADPPAPAEPPPEAAEEANGDPELDALLAGLDSPADAALGTPAELAPTTEAASEEDTDLDVALASLDEPSPAPEASVSEPEPSPIAPAPPSLVDTTPPAPEEPPPVEDEDADEPADSTGDPDLDALLAELAPAASAPAATSAGDLDPSIAALLEGLE